MQGRLSGGIGQQQQAQAVVETAAVCRLGVQGLDMELVQQITGDIQLQQLAGLAAQLQMHAGAGAVADRKSTRLNSSHVRISYAVFCLKKKKAMAIAAAPRGALQRNLERQTNA